MLGNIYNMKGESALGNQFTVRSNDFISFSPPVDTLIDKLVLLSRSELFLLKKIDEAEKSFYSDWALQLINHGLQYLPDNKHLISKAIKILLWKNLNDQAIGFIDKHMQLFWDDYIEIKNTGIIFYQKDLFSQAAKYWTRALELKPGETLIQEYLARSLWFSGDKQKSVKILDELVANNPGNTEVLIDVTSLLLEFGQKEKAQNNLTNLKNMASSNPKYLRISAEISAGNGKSREAIHLYEASFRIDPTDTKTIVNLGAIYRNQKMWNKYIELYRNSLEYYPNNPDFLARLGEILISCPEPSFRNIKEGKVFVERAFTYYNCPPDILISAGSHLAYAYSLLGDKQKAITTVSQTINIGRRQN
ncbi:MAG: hypothetical protein LC658_15035, partial [Bacteroidales bacterium]|nr:hypothetical protein [Bacteroidales bacterium]